MKIDKKLEKKYTPNKHSYLEIEEGSTSLEIKILKKGFNLITKIQNMNPWIRYPLAATLIIIGVFGVILPIIPGFVFLIAGVGIFSKRSQVFLENKLESYINWREDKID